MRDSLIVIHWIISSDIEKSRAVPTQFADTEADARAEMLVYLIQKTHCLG